jgi:hypothetical protein
MKGSGTREKTPCLDQAASMSGSPAGALCLG